MDEMTQQNAALVEEAAAAAESMSSQASQLISRVNFFDIGDSSEHAPAPVAAEVPTAKSKPRVPAKSIAPRAQQFSAAAPNDDDEWESF